MRIQEVDTKPMMADHEIKIIDDLLEKHKPKLCLEWGSGNSTTYFPKHKSIELWLAVEHDGHYLDYLQDKCPANVQTLWILPGTSYADVVQRSNRKFDFILIDGLDRAKCLENGLKVLNKGGIILLHDAGRKAYEGMIKEFKGETLVEGEIVERDGGFAHRGLAVFYGL